ncbi:MAG: cytochrome b [Pseudomonadota bacterium]
MRLHLQSDRIPGRGLLGVSLLVALLTSLPVFGQPVTGAELPDLEEYYRLPGHIDSWIALAIVVASVLIAITLNNSAPAVRTTGTVMAALGCFAVTGWFAVVKSTGIIEEPREALFPTDAARPTILWAIALLSFLAGAFLLRCAGWQSRRNDELSLPVTNTDEKFGRASRYLHWTTAILFLSLIPMGFFTSMIPYDVPWRQGYYVIHKTIGFTVLLLVLVRIIWHIRTSTPALDGSLKTWEHRLAKSAHVFLYLLMLAVPITGFIMSTYGGKWSHFFVWDLPLFWEQDMEAIKPFGLLHKVVLPYLTLIIIGAHIIGALKHHFVDRHRDSIHRMVS